MKEHTPVMVKEVLYFLDVKAGKRYIDATLGGGGHTEAILQKGGEVLGIDQDPKAIAIAKRRLKACPGVFKLIPGNFSKIAEIASSDGWKPAAGILFDLGFASFQIEDRELGLSFSTDSPLDMRMDSSLGVSAADLVNSLPEKELARLFSEVGEERFSRTIAKTIVQARTKGALERTVQLAKLIEDVYKTKGWYAKSKIHPATKVFMALRIAVNNEFENLRDGLAGSMDILAKGGRLVVLSFHSGEDRIVKKFFRQSQRRGVFQILTKKPIRPSLEELDKNLRARSAKLRAVEKI